MQDHYGKMLITLRNILLNMIIDLLTITETWLTYTDQDIINGITFNSAIYTYYRCDRITSTFGGGVAIFLKNNMT